MARAHGREAVVKIDDSGGVLRDISGDVRSVDAPGDTDTAEVSGFGQVKKSYVVGLSDSKVALEGAFDNIGTTSAHAVLSGLQGGTAGYSFEFHPKGTATGNPKLTGEVYLAGYGIKAAVDAAVTWTANLVAAGTAGLVWGTN